MVVSGTGWTPARAATTPATTASDSSSLPSAPTSPTPSASADTALLVTPNPCGAPTAASGCTTDPTSLAASWPSADSVGGVTVAWQGQGRPAAAPAPADPDQALSVSKGTCTVTPSGPTTTCTWEWPAGLRHPSGGQLLNGSYLVTACSNDPTSANGTGSPSCTAAAGLSSATVAVGVVPAAPSGVAASGASRVTVNWNATSDPDLAGYRVTRDGTLIWTCAADGAGGAGPCPASPSVADTPAAGHHTYGVTALAFGPSPSAPLLVSPVAAAAIVVAPVSAAAAGGGGGGGGGGGAQIALGPVPYVGPAVTVPAARAPSSPVTSAPPAPADSGFAPTLPYNTSRAPAVPLAVSPRSPGEAGTGTSSASVRRAALFALGMLILAIAAHLVFLRSEMARREAGWRALRQAAGLPAAPVSTDTPGAGGRSPSGSALERLMLWRPTSLRR
ncbi:hypothetical protein K6U06_23925 [Acidiferrimicrobium sp. IK]|uniref:hypothetical protein n=1 Tax=Acidiferrimicrobium sp. IK TaxID=2871700 RepID=UPI0021CB44DB|nr:hypothetical protein [Acidiferrimicrobium sp. IK]MCU4187428.1 hypothetical protein [Acidiferrimicrobium sp. IK]